MNDTITTLQNELDVVTDKSKQVGLLNRLAWEMRNRDNKLSLEYALRAGELAERLGDLSGLGWSLCHRGLAEMNITNPQTGIPFFYSAIDTAQKAHDAACHSQALYYLGVAFSRLADLHRSTRFQEEALELARSVNDSNLMSLCLSYLSNTYEKLGELDASYAHAGEALELARASDNRANMGTALMHMGNTAMKLNRDDEAYALLTESLEIRRGINDVLGIGATLDFLGRYYLKVKRFDEAEVCMKESLGMATSYNIRWAQAYVYTNLASLKLAQGQMDEALALLEKGRDVAEQMNLHENLSSIWELFSQAYEMQGDYQQALEAHKKFFSIRKEVMQSQATKKLENEQMLNQIEKARQETEIHRLKNVELKLAYDEIRDSISYAKRIQEAILPTSDEVSNLLPGSFVCFMPRDIVSGDFYFVESLRLNDGTPLVAFAAADCTGHGVPGAFMSILGYDILRQSLTQQHVNSPGEALDFLNQHLSLALRQQSKGVQMRDGMDIAFCVLNTASNMLHFAGANNSCVVIHHDGTLTELKADKQPVGFFENQQLFSTQSLQLHKGDMIYLFSDGYADQFGGPQGKKFKRKNLKELLTRISPQPVAEQHEALTEAFTAWKGNLEQVDDVLVIGVRIV